MVVLERTSSGAIYSLFFPFPLQSLHNERMSMNVDLELLLAEGRLATVGKLFPVLLHHLKDKFPHLGVLGQHLVKKDQIEKSKMLKAIKIHLLSCPRYPTP